MLVPSNIACGKCWFCQQEMYGNCHESNPEATAVGGIFGYSHTAGGYDGGQNTSVCLAPTDRRLARERISCRRFRACLGQPQI